MTLLEYEQRASTRRWHYLERTLIQVWEDVEREKFLPIVSELEWRSSEDVSGVFVVHERLYSAIWVDKHKVIDYSHTAPELSSPDGYRLGITPSQYRIKPTQKNSVVHALQIPTCPLKNYVTRLLKQSTGTSPSQCPLKAVSVSARDNVTY